LDTVSYRVPLGVCAGIAPFNFPAMIALWMFPLAIACGNTYVLKPTEKAPSAAMLLVKHLHDLGLPDGVVNVVNGGRETANALLVHPDVRAASFVGSNAAGEHLHDLGGRYGKRVQANLGAKNHATVMMDDFASADDRRSTARAIVGAAFGAAGQRCMALSVVVLVGGTEDAAAWVGELVGLAGGLRVGNGFDEGVDVGERAPFAISLSLSLSLSFSPGLRPSSCRVAVSVSVVLSSL
jgi:malonate-semialdehyde dehydrogenase (acetylating)/methylmalonate-semialdehyde dehydrogenase